MEDPDAFLSIAGSRWFRLEATLAEVLSGLAGVVPDAVIRMLVDRLPQLADLDADDVLVSRAWVKVLYAIPQDA
jgi:hypothetical protein